MPGRWYVISAESFLDRMTEMPDVLTLAPRIRCPVPFLRGDTEAAANDPAEACRRRAGGPAEAVVVSDCDHFRRGCEDRVAEIVAAWLGRTLGLPDTSAA